MIKAISSIESLEAPLRSLLMQQCELQADYVLNALNLRGPAMQKATGTLGEEKFEAFSQNDSVVVFEVKEHEDSHSERVDSESNGQDTSTLFTVLGIELKVIVYGRNSRTLSQKLKARLEASAVRDACYKFGLNFQYSSDIEDSSEFINDVLWLRRDISFFFNAHMDVTEITHEQSFDNAPDISVEEVSD